MATITEQHLEHARTHRKDCSCYKDDERDPWCRKGWPDLCPWWAMQLHRHHTGDQSNSEWWAWQTRYIGTSCYGSDPPPPRRPWPPMRLVVNNT
jgi:hypothetical protein